MHATRPCLCLGLIMPRKRLSQFANSDKSLQRREMKNKQCRKRKLERLKYEEKQNQIEIQWDELKALVLHPGGLPVVVHDTIGRTYMLPLERNVYTFVTATDTRDDGKKGTSTTFVAQLTHISVDILKRRPHQYHVYKVVFQQTNPFGMWSPNNGSRDFRIYWDGYVSENDYGAGGIINIQYSIENFQCEQSRWIVALGDAIVSLLVTTFEFPKVLATLVVENFYVPEQAPHQI
jgi:hypothetical protein